MENKTINYLHLVYITIIFVILLFAIWFISPHVVCEESLMKFEFAATITSIVLAVVSIVYSIYSGQGISQNLGSMREASEKIGNVGKDFEIIKTGLNDEINRLSNIEISMQNILTEIHNTKGLIKDLKGDIPYNGNTNQTDEEFVFSKTSIVGQCIIYACSLAFKQNKSFPINLVGDPTYVHGYITALETCAPRKFRATGQSNGYVYVSVFDKTFFKDITAESIEQQILSNPMFEQMKPILQSIRTYFGIKS